MSDDADPWVDRLRQDDGSRQEALAEALTQWRDRLRRMVEVRLDRRLQGRVDPSDVIQEAFLEVSSRLEDYLQNPAMPFFVWVRFIASQKLMICHRRHLDTKLRDAAREVSLFRGTLPDASSAVLADQLLGRLTSPSQAALRAERKARLEKALDEMKPIDREVLLLRHFEELTNSETAGVLGMSTTAANNRYVRALKRLHEILTRMPGGERDLTS